MHQTEIEKRLAVMGKAETKNQEKQETADPEEEIVRVIPAGQGWPEIPITRREQRKMDDASRQPQNDETPFHVGMKEKRTGYPLAIPPYKWPSPGALYADSVPVWEAYEKYLTVWMSSAQALQRYLLFLYRRMRHPDEDNAMLRHCNEEAQRDLAYLRGIWASHNVAIPTEEYLKAVAAGEKPWEAEGGDGAA